RRTPESNAHAGSLRSYQDLGVLCPSSTVAFTAQEAFEFLASLVQNDETLVQFPFRRPTTGDQRVAQVNEPLWPALRGRASLAVHSFRRVTELDRFPIIRAAGAWASFGIADTLEHPEPEAVNALCPGPVQGPRQPDDFDTGGLRFLAVFRHG